MKHQRLDPPAADAAPAPSAPRLIPPIPVPAFTPVPLRARADGWTPVRQRAFIAALACTGCVSGAAAALGMTRETAYRLRARPGAASFVAAWRAAIAAARPVRHNHVHDYLWRRAFLGNVRPIVRNGEEVALLHTRDDRALLRLYDRAMRGATPPAGRSQSQKPQ